MPESLVKKGIENARLAALESYQVLDTLPEKEYDSIARLASFICKTPISTITFIDAENQFHKSHIGMGGGKSSREDSIWELAILQDGIIEICDAFLDTRTSEFNCVLGDPNIRFYAGAPLITPEGLRVGTLCVIDIVPRKLDKDQKVVLKALSEEVVSHLETRKKNIELQHLLRKYEEINVMFDSSPEIHCILDRYGNILIINNVVEKMLGYSAEEGIGKSIWDYLFEDDIKAMIPIIESGLSSGQKNFEVEGRIKLKSGEYKWFGWSVAIKKDNWYVNARDINHQKMMVSELEQLSLVANSVNNGVVISDSNSILFGRMRLLK